MAEVDTDSNFAFLMIMLTIVLLSIIAGAKINEIVIHRNGVISEAIWQFVFVLMAMVILALAILMPYLSYELGHFSVLTGAIKLGVMFMYYNNDPGSFFNLGEEMVMGEAISAILLVISGTLLLKSSKKETLADKLKKKD